MKTRYSFGGDEHVFVECDEEMSLEAFFKSLSMATAVRKARIKGVTEICPANASMQVKFDPDRIKPADMLKELKAIEKAAAKAKPVIKSRIIEIPVYYNDPWTHETLMRFRERHQDPKSTDIEYTARINNLDGVEGIIKAHSGAPWFVSMVGFVAGLLLCPEPLKPGDWLPTVWRVGDDDESSPLTDAAQADRLRSLRQHALPINAWKRFTHANSVLLSPQLTELGHKANYTDLQAAMERNVTVAEHRAHEARRAWREAATLAALTGTFSIKVGSASVAL